MGNGGHHAALEDTAVAPAPTTVQTLRRCAVSAAVTVAIFGFALPHLVDYGDAWRAFTSMSGGELTVVLVAGLWNLFTYWPVLVLSLPGLRLTEAAVVNQASTAVANTVPAGGVVALGVTYRFLRAWGFTSHGIANQVVATGAWNTLVKLTLPVGALIAMAATGELGDASPGVAAIGVGALVALGLTTGWALADERTTRRLGGWIDAVLQRGPLRGHRSPGGSARWLVTTRRELLALIHRRGVPMTVATLMSHLSLYLVLLASVRGAGVPDDELSWAKLLAGFAFVRLLSALPVTPGGLGIVEFGYVAYFTAGSEHLTADVTAAVLLFRAVTFALPVALGAVAWLVFSTRSSWRRPPGSRAESVSHRLDGAMS